MRLDILTESLDDLRTKYKDLSDDMFYEIASIDPTYVDGSNQEGEFTNWLLSMYTDGEIKEEDFAKVNRYLTLFDKYRSYFGSTRIEYYHSLRSLEDSLRDVKRRIDSKGNEEKERERTLKGAKRDILNQAEVVENVGRWVIYVPKTHEAAYALSSPDWSIHDKRSDYYFKKYNEEGPIYIIIDKVSGERYLAHFTSGGFLDINGDDYSLSDLVYRFPELKNWFDGLKSDAFKDTKLIADNQDYKIYFCPDSAPLAFTNLNIFDCSYLHNKNIYLIIDNTTGTEYAFDNEQLVLYEGDTNYGTSVCSFNDMFKLSKSLDLVKDIKAIVKKRLLKSGLTDNDESFKVIMSKVDLQDACEMFSNNSGMASDFVVDCIDGDLYSYYDSNYYDMSINDLDSYSHTFREEDCNQATLDILAENNISIELFKDIWEKDAEDLDIDAELVNDIKRAIVGSLADGYICGSQQAAESSFWNSIEEATGCNVKYDGEVVTFEGKFEFLLDKWFECNDDDATESPLDINDILKVAISHMDFEEPYYGWEGFDDNAFYNRLDDELYEVFGGRKNG